MLEIILFFLIVLAIICVAIPPIGAIIIPVLSMPIKFVFGNLKITGPLIAVLIILLAIGIIKF